MKSIALAYCIDNIKIAEEIERHLSRASYSFEHYYCKRTTNEEALSEQLRAKRDPVLLIISDNFLKSAQCMSGGLKLLQERGADILPIVVNGQTKDIQTGNLTPVITQFDRVSDIIKYINYWQDQYLDLRKQKRQMHDELDEEAFNKHLRVMRDVSGEVGEFLRTLRNMDYISYDEFSANSFENFFQFTDDAGSWHNFRDLQPITSSMQPVTEVLEEMEEPEVDIADIPGISQIMERPYADEAEVAPQESQSIHSQQDEATAEPEEEEEIRTTIEENVAEVFTKNNAFEFLEHSDAISHTEEEQDEYIEPTEESLTLLQEETQSNEGEAQPEEIIDTAEEMLLEIEALIQQEEIEDALEQLENALEHYPDHAELRYRHATLLALDETQRSRAIEELDLALERAPKHEDALFLRGQLAELEEDFLMAKHAYEKVVEENDENSDALYRLGMVLMANFPNEIEQAAKYFKKAAKYDPDNLDALYRYANLLAEHIGKSKKAIKYFKKVLNDQPDHPFANYDLAVLYHKMGDKADAREYYLRAVKINPELKTPENDKAFEFKIKAKDFMGEKGITEDTIETMKQSIRQLEEMLEAHAQAAQEAETQTDPLPGIGKTVLITGATSGIGRATAELFAANGFRLILTGRRAERLEALESELEEQHPTAVKTLTFDVRNMDSVKTAIDSLGENWQEIDILINNAGKAKGFNPIHEGKLEHWEEMIDTNIKGLLYMTRLVSPMMVKRNRGHIINIGSTAGKEVYPNGNVYCATKFAVDALTKSMRIDLHPYNIRVSQISPGHVEETEFALVRFDGDAERAKIYQDFKPLTSHDVAETLLFAVTRPAHVNIQEILLMGTQQASSTMINRSGRDIFEEEEE